MPLTVAVGHATATGSRARNEDFVGLTTPSGPTLTAKGVLAAVADGISGGENGREAAEYVARGLLTDYYATPDTWEPPTALGQVVKALNAWVYAQATARGPYNGMGTTLTALVLRGRRYFLAHVGDTRAYLWRQGHWQRLTTDHVWDRPEQEHVLTRAVGLDQRVLIDHGSGDLQRGDVFLLATDGVWAALTDAELAVMMSAVGTGRTDAEAAAAQLVELAAAKPNADNATAAVLYVEALAELSANDLAEAAADLPVPDLKPGDRIDGLIVDAVLAESRASRVWRVHHRGTGEVLVLKSLHPDRASDPLERAAFAHEQWIARRAAARFFPAVVDPPEGPSANYLLTTFHPGATLEARLAADQHFPVAEVVRLGCLLARALGALHRRGIIHRDIKPANLHLGEDGQLRIIDFGLAESGVREDVAAPLAPDAGTPSFLAPEQFAGLPASPRTDLYAAGVSLYFLLTRHYPYGEIEPFQRPRFREPTPPTRWRPDVPAWLEAVLLKAVARDAIERFETAEEMLLALERGPGDGTLRRRTPLVDRDPVRLLGGLLIASLVANLLLVYLLVAR